MKWSAILTPIPCAVLFCLASAFKPATIDDLGYIWYARQIAVTPLEPFGPPPDGFYLIWYNQGQPAFTLLTPMVMPYWHGLGIALFGEHLILMKLWLLPICLLFSASLYSLLKRFAPGLEKPLLALTIFSPTFLPSLNVMVDVPALAFNLAAVAVFCRALDERRPRWRLVVLAGLLAGLAAQTKYNGATAIGVLLLYGLTRRQWRASFVAISIAVALFTGWEAYLSHVYGRSHFLSQLEQRRTKVPAHESATAIERWAGEIAAAAERKAGMTIPLLGYLGGLGLPLIPLMMIAWRFRMNAVHWSAGVLLIGFLLMMLLPTRWAELHRDANDPRILVTVGTLFMGLAGFYFALLLAGSCALLAFRRGLWIRRSSTSWFLIGWLGIELLGFYALSPFTATRRVMSILVIATIIAGRLLLRTARPMWGRHSCLPADRNVCPTLAAGAPMRRWVWLYCALGIGFGSIYAWTDYRDAVAERDALYAGIQMVRERSGTSPRIWFTGHWGFQYYGEREGLQTIYPRESIVDEGDWIIIPDVPPRPHAQPLHLEMPFAEKRGVVEIHDCWPLETNPIYYDGYMPIRRHDGYRLRIAVFQAKKRFIAWPSEAP